MDSLSVVTGAVYSVGVPLGDGGREVGDRDPGHAPPGSRRRVHGGRIIER
jgi:hypothetical protein